MTTLYSCSLVNTNNGEDHKITFELLPKPNTIIPPNMTEQEKMAWITMFQDEYPARIVKMDGISVENGYAFAYSVGLSRLSSTKTIMQKSRSKLLGLEPLDKSSDADLPSLFSSICYNGIYYESPEKRPYLFPETIVTPKLRSIPDSKREEYEYSPERLGRVGRIIGDHVVNSGIPENMQKFTVAYSNFPKNAHYFRLSDLCESKAVIVKIFENTMPFLDKSGTFQHKALILATETKKGEWTAGKMRATLFVFEGKCQAILDHESHLIYSIVDRIDIRKMAENQTQNSRT